MSEPASPSRAAPRSDRPWRLAALPPLPLEALQGMLAGQPVDVVVPATRDAAGVRAVLTDAELVIGDWTNQLTLGAAEAEAAAHLAYVHQPNVGVEHIDLAAFAACDVPVSNGAGVNAVSVAEWCLAATLALMRALAWADAEVRAGRWPQTELISRGSRELAGARVGIVGFGPIGVECARRFAALGCPVSYWSRRRRDPEQEHGATYRELDDLLARSDVLVVVVALGPGTRDLLDAARLALLPRGAYVVNAARGGIVDEQALLAALDSGALAGAALDVFSTEPPPADSPLLSSGRVLLSPHGAGATVQGAARMIQVTVDNVRRAVSGEPVVNVLNGVDPVVRRR